MEAGKEKLKKWFSTIGGPTEVPAEQNTNVRIKDLPLYPPTKDVSQYRFVEDPPLPMQKELSVARSQLQNGYYGFLERYGTAQRVVNKTANAAKTTSNYIREEGTVIPKAIAITIGGMAGFLFGMKRGGVFKRTAYSGVGLGTMAAFCYPHETVDMFRHGVASVRHYWLEFKAPPPPPSKVHVSAEEEELPPMPDANENIDMYTTRSRTIS